MLTPTELEIAAWYAEGREQGEMAGWLGCNQSTVSRHIDAIQATLKRSGIPPIVPLIEKHNTRHNRNLTPEFMRAA